MRVGLSLSAVTYVLGAVVAAASHLLLESGNALLLEDGSGHILTETS